MTFLEMDEKYAPPPAGKKRKRGTAALSVETLPDVIAIEIHDKPIGSLDLLIDLQENPFSALQNLYTLTMTDCTFFQNTFPAALFAVRRLEHLCVAHCVIQTIPDQFNMFPLLKSLQLTFLSLTVLPESIALCTNLETLDISNNAVSVIPDGICALPKLRVLIANANAIENIPQKLCTAPCLSHLYLSSNCLSDLPEILYLAPKLKVLYANGNPLKSKMNPEKCLKLTDTCKKLIKDMKVY